MSEQTTVEQTTTTAETAQLQLTDILVALQAINLASTRGAFKAEEFTQVGGAYDRIVAFLQASGALQPAPTESTGESATDETVAE
jgi:hypothetical protein